MVSAVYRRGIEAAERTRREIARGQEILAIRERRRMLEQWARENKLAYFRRYDDYDSVIVGDETFAGLCYDFPDAQSFARIALAIDAGAYKNGS